MPLLAAFAAASGDETPFARAVDEDEIVIDGNAADWPEDEQRYAIEERGGSDLSASLRLNYSADERILYVLVESPELLDRTELFVDAKNDVVLGRPAQLIFEGEISAAQPQHTEAIRAAGNESGNGSVVEWAIDLGALAPDTPEDENLVIGFDTELVTTSGRRLQFGDKDNKWLFDRRLTEVILLASPHKFGVVEGHTRWNDRRREPAPTMAEIKRIGNEGFTLRIETDPETGHFSASVPAGTYSIQPFDTRTTPSLTKTRRARVTSGETSRLRPLIARRPKFSDLERVITEVTELHNINAVGVVYIRSGNTVHSGVHGVMPDGSPADQASMFKMASVTKPVAASVVLSLIDKGLWSLDEPLATYWIDPDIAGDDRAGKVTTRMVLSHRTGLPNHRGDDPLAFTYPPGSVQSYSGEGYTWLRRALEAHFEMSFQELAETHLFNPAGMVHASFQGPKSRTEYLGKFHNTYQFETPSWDESNLKGGLMIGTDGLEHFLSWILAGSGWSDGLWKEVTEANHQAILSDDTQAFDTFGLGWVVNRDGPLTLSHGGSEHGARTYIVLLPEERSALVVATNSSGGLAAIRSVVEATLMQDYDLPAIDAALAHWEEFEW